MTTPSRRQWVYTTAATPMTTQWASTAAADRAVILPLTPLAVGHQPWGRPTGAPQSRSQRGPTVDSNTKQPGTPAAQQWRSRPGLSRMIRLAVLVIPTVASVAACLLLERLLPRPVGGVATVTWWLLTTTGSLATLTLGVRLMPRLLPLASLLELSLVFPDHAPRRFAVARSSWRVR